MNRKLADNSGSYWILFFKNKKTMNFTSYTLQQYLCLLLCWGSLSLNAQTLFQAHLTGHQEALPVATLASGEVSASLEAGKLTVSGSFSNLSAAIDTALLGGAHIHLGFAGQNGAVVFPLIVTYDEDFRGGTFDAANNVFDVTPDEIMSLEGRQWYVNIHSLNHSGGEIRGQILPVADAHYSANLFGSYEVPLVMSTGSGSVAIDLIGSEMTVTGSFQGLEGDLATDINGGAHIHLAPAGVNGDVVVPITATLNSDMRSGVFAAEDNLLTLDSAQIAALDARQFYVNLHSTKNPSGELRGQIVGGDTRTVFRSHLSGSNEVPVVTSTATGMTITEVRDDTTILVTGSFQNLESDLATELLGGAHLHQAMAGSNGDVITPLAVSTTDNKTGTFEAVNNQYAVSAAQMTNLYQRGIYTNIHSADHGGGELRGQLLPESQVNFNGFLSSIFEVPPASSQALGGLKIELQGTQLTVSGSFDNLSSAVATEIAGGTHLHLAAAGSTGDVEFLLTATLDEDVQGGMFAAADNTFEFSPEQVTNLRSRLYYANIHSLNHPSGELRAQILHEATTYFVAPLSGASEVSPVNTPASGMMVLEYNGGKGFLSGSFDGLQSDFAADIAGGAHIHRGLAGSTGPAVALLNTAVGDDNRSGQFEIMNNALDISSDFLDTMRMRMHFANIHSIDEPGGEIRGQFLPLATAYFMANLEGLNEVQPISVNSHGATILELTGNELTLSGSFADLSSQFDGNVAGGSHIHAAAVGENGDIVFTLGPALQPDLLGGIFPANNNVNELSAEQLEQLFDGNFYINLHTVDFGSGELRGQILPEINFFPTDEATIISPTDGMMLTIEGTPSTPFSVTWNSATDRDDLAYIWQLSTDEDFNSLVLQTNVGMETSFSTDYEAIDMLLADAGLMIGDMMTLYHRAIASDGSLNTPASSSSVTLTRGELMEDANTADLELMILGPANYDIYVPVPYIITITNNGPLEATNVFVEAGLPTGMVHTSNSVTSGIYNLFFETWFLPTLGVGESATLTLTLFPLVGDIPITNFVQVSAADQEDPDSTPGNDTDQTPDEDDESALTVMPTNIPPMGGTDSDLELSITTDTETYGLYENVVYTLTLANNGPDAAANIDVSAGVPTGMVHTSSSATTGSYDLFFETWTVPFLETGESATLTLALFTLTSDVPITNFVQIMAADQADPDSTPGNDMDGTADEDDEASVTISPAANIASDSERVNLFNNNQYLVYPVPTTNRLYVAFESDIKTSQVIRLYNLQGQLMQQKVVNVFEGKNILEFDVHNLVVGTYFIKIGQEELALKFNKL